MEPPRKKARHGAAPFESDGDEGEDDDELSYHPLEVSARRDPDYKLNMKRAQADHKFKSTMAQIIEKYSRNFDGIGDEIDLETGEIVVNNGHVRNMRNEADVGETWADTQDDEDEGILLEDLTDEYSDNQDEAAEPEVPDDQNKDDEVGEDTVPRQKMATPSAASVPTTGDAVNQMHPDAWFSAMYPNPYAAFSPHSFGGPPNMGFGPPYSSFGAMPYHLPPWAVPQNGLPGNGWSYPHPADISMQQAQYNRQSLGGQGRPASDEHGSIWAPGSCHGNPWRSRTSVRTGLKKKPPKSVVDPDKQKIPRNSEDDVEAQSGDENDQQLSSSAARPQCDSLEIPKSTISDSDEEDNLTPSATGRSSGQQRSSPEQRKALFSRGKLVSSDQEPKHNGLNEQGVSRKALQLKEQNEHILAERETEDDSDSGCRRRSGRTRKQVEYMGKVSWSQVFEERRQKATFSIELQSPDPARRNDFIRIEQNTVEDEYPSSASRDGDGGMVQNSDATAAKRKVIPDSQDSTTPASSAAQQGQTQELRATTSSRNFSQDVDSACVLSDDEAPIPLTRPHQPTKQDSTRKVEVGIPPEKANDSKAEATEPVEAEMQVRKRGRPRKPKDLSIAPPADSPCHSSTEEPRKRGRPRKIHSSIAGDLNASDQTVSKKVTPSEERRESISSDQAKTLTLDDGNPVQPPDIKENQGQMDEGLEEPHHHDEHGASLAKTVLGEEPQPSSTPQKHFKFNYSEVTPSKHTSTPSKPKPQTPRHSSIRTTRAPSSRRSILSLLSDEDSDNDELSRLPKAPSSFSQSSDRPSGTRKLWRSSALTTEVYHTPVKKRMVEVLSPGSVVKTPGGTTRMCGVDGFRCGRDFCFTCL